jgi:hypothetical protein
MEKIICGFAGIGKSYLAKNRKCFVDLESTPFNKNWDLYSDVAIHMANNGYNVMLSCHKELREILKKKNAKYTVCLPPKKEKYKYLQRYKDRGNDGNFIKLFEEKFDEFIDDIKKTEDHIFWLNNEFLEDVI